MKKKSPITTHVLDTATGFPAEGIAVELSMESGGQWSRLAAASTNADGRITDLLPADHALKSGHYRMRFDTGRYFQSQKVEGFYPCAEIVFTIRDPKDHYHIPLLLSPFGYSTYRGS